MSKRVKVVYVVQDVDLLHFVSRSFMDFVSKCNRILESIPEGYRQSAQIVLYRRYNDCIDIYYRREETDEEEKQRIHAEIARLNDLKAQELRMLAELKAKYESGTGE